VDTNMKTDLITDPKSYKNKLQVNYFLTLKFCRLEQPVMSRP